MCKTKLDTEKYTNHFFSIEHMPVFFSAPHRVMFFTGVIQLILVLFFWLIELTGNLTTLWAPLSLTVPATWAHVFLMIYGLYPFFIFGFLMTTYPRWLQTGPLSFNFYLPAFFLMTVGMLLFYIGIISIRLLVELSMIVYFTGWLIALIALLTVYFRATVKPSLYETILSTAVTIGFLGGCASLYWLLSGSEQLYQLSILGGFWLFLMPVLVTVSHRMIPFFSSCAIENYDIVRPVWSLPVILFCLFAHTALTLTGLTHWSFIFDFIMAGAAFYLTCLWGFKQSLKIPLLGMLHIGFLWLSIGMVMYGIQNLTLFISGYPILGKAPLHAIGIGFATSMVLSMATRVTLGHSGRNLIAAKFTIGCFFLLQMITVFRIFGDIPHIVFSNMYYWTLLAGVSWIACFLLWGSYFIPIYLKPRADGKPG